MTKIVNQDRTEIHKVKKTSDHLEIDNPEKKRKRENNNQQVHLAEDRAEEQDFSLNILHVIQALFKWFSSHQDMWKIVLEVH
jgi:hypothetical protein